MTNFFIDLTSFTVAPPLYGSMGRMEVRTAGWGVAEGWLRSRVTWLAPTRDGDLLPRSNPIRLVWFVPAYGIAVLLMGSETAAVGRHPDTRVGS